MAAKIVDALKRIVDVVNTTFNAYMAYDESLPRNNRRWWVRPVNLSRDTLGFFKTCMEQIQNQDEEHFHKATRMSVPQYELLLALIRPKLQKYSRRKPIEPEQRLTLTLLYLAHGCSFQVLAWSHKMGVSTVREIVYETCQVIWNELHETYVAEPNKQQWSVISSSFYEQTGLPHCLGAIDGKHISIMCPQKSGSIFFNYKKYFSIVLLAACDADYAFTFVDVGAFGSQSDSGVFRKSAFGKKILNCEFDVPPPNTLPNSNIVFPYYFVGDNAFPLLSNLMRPYPGRNLPGDKRCFNTTLSQTRCRIEISFGVLANRWRVLHTTINSMPTNVDKIVLATVVLHNFLISHKDKRYFDPAAIDEYLDQLESVRFTPSNHSSSEAFNLRNALKDYLSSN